MQPETAARGLGWASIGIGLSELAAPQQIERALGLEEGEYTDLLRILGVRELMHGVDILSHKDPGPGVMARVAGDILDTALLGLAATQTRRPASFGIIFGMVAAIGVLDLIFARPYRDGNQQAA